MIKYLGSKLKFLPTLEKLFVASRAETGLDLFTGTTRVAQTMKRSGIGTIAADSSRYSEVFGKCWIETDKNGVDQQQIYDICKMLNGLDGEPGYFTETFCEDARFVQPHNGERVDVIRQRIEHEFGEEPLTSILLSSLILAVDKVDSTCGQQAAYLKDWASRSHKPLVMLPPDLLPGKGLMLRGDAEQLVKEISAVDLAYLDPPYNQVRYYSYYHMYETLVAWDKPETYGVANRRMDVRDPDTKTGLDSKKTFADTLSGIVDGVNTKTLVMSYNNESWLTKDQLTAMCDRFEQVEVLEFEAKRYVGSRIGQYGWEGEKVSEATHHTNLEYMVVAGPATTVQRMIAAI